MTDIAQRQTTSQPRISSRDLEVIITTAAAHSRKLGRSLKLSPAEQEDAEQDILVMLLERWHYFDGSRGSSIGFAIRIARQVAQGIADRIAASWKDELVSFEEPVPWQEWGTDDASWISELIADEALPDESAHCRVKRAHVAVRSCPCSDEPPALPGLDTSRVEVIALRCRRMRHDVRIGPGYRVASLHGE